MRAARLQAYGEILITVIIWGIASIVIKVTLSGVTPVLFLSYRFFLSSLVALPTLGRIIHLFKNPSTRIPVIIYAVLSGPVALGILFIGLNETSVVNLALLSAIEPLILTVLAAKIFHDHLSKKARIGAAIAVMGAVLTVIEPMLENTDPGSFHGNILVMIYLVADIAGVLLLKKLMKKHVEAFPLTNLSFITGFLFFVPLLLLQNTGAHILSAITNLSPWYHVGIFYMALLSGTYAYTLRAKAQKTLPVSEVSLFSYLTPLITTILALIFLNEHITVLYVLGGILITIGVLVVETKKKHFRN
jgi:drug/metabolite transporter (DMT)-like permease